MIFSSIQVSFEDLVTLKHYLLSFPATVGAVFHHPGRHYSWLIYEAVHLFANTNSLVPALGPGAGGGVSYENMGLKVVPRR